MKKTIKILVVAMLAFAMVFALAACGQKEEAKKNTETNKVATVTMEGSVISANDGVLKMTTATGNEFEFNIGDASVHVELTEGAPITVEFEGTEDQPGKLLKVY